MGEPYGPHYGLGDNVSDYVLYDPWLRTQFTPPLMHDIAVIEIAHNASVGYVYGGNVIQINVTVKNEGTAFETFNVTVYYDDNKIGTEEVVDLIPGGELILTFYWNTETAMPCHAYTITAIADTVPDETNVDNNVFTDGLVKIKLLGDMDGDGKVDIKDLVLLIKAFGSYPGHLRWNSNADFNSDSRIDIKDLILLVKNFGKTC
ncbi:MAG: CARDB domain-containing protein [Candidatus Bathyarchaeota archaeon]|nr:CARDB domain-containing protein [Candidatus Bathyarchaeota archaeon]